MGTRVVLAMGSAKQRTLTRVGLELSGLFDVVGVAVDEADVEFIVGSLRPDVVLIDLPSTEHGGLPLVSIARGAHADTVPVMYGALVARHHAETGAAGPPRPAEVARLLERALTDRAPALCTASR